MSSSWKKYILWFAQEHVDFRCAEFESISKLFGLQFRKITTDALKPFWIVEFLNDENARKYASRSIALRCILELWSHSDTSPQFHQNLRRYLNQNEKQLLPYLSNCRFKITVETYNKHFSQSEKIEKIESFDYLPIEGKVDLKTPEVEWLYIEFWGLNPTEVPDAPYDVLFGRLIANGQRHLIKELSLKKRKFIGNTSMDAQLSLLMANQALVQNGDIVFDPFVGTGSLLVSAAKFGGYVLGSDIDFMTIHARSRPSRITQMTREKDESIRANLKQYGCAERYLDVVVSDFTNQIWRENLQFDSIITDPPYGIREATERIETKESSKANLRTENMPHYPSTTHYSLQALYSDLLSFAALHLKIGGRLVCWLPFHRDNYSDKIVPHHPYLNLVANSEQPLTGLTSRRLLTYEKHSELLQSSSENIVVENSPIIEFRERYFDNKLESRSERRLRKTEQRQHGRIEALKRGKVLSDGREYKCNLNKARFNL